MQDVSNLLQDGEEILWAGSPQYASAKRAGWNGRLTPWVVLIGLTGALAGIAWLATSIQGNPFVIGILGAIAAPLAIGWTISLVVALQQKSEGRRPAETYHITNMRLLVVNADADRHHSYFKGSVLSISSMPNGSVRDLTLYLGGDQDASQSLWALGDAAQVENLLIKTGIARRADK